VPIFSACLDDQRAVPFCEVRGLDVEPAARLDDQRRKHRGGQRDHPQHVAGRSLDDPGHDHQRRQDPGELGDREHEDQVEEELQGADPQRLIAALVRSRLGRRTGSVTG
jgi:hypothetical protein